MISFADRWLHMRIVRIIRKIFLIYEKKDKVMNKKVKKNYPHVMKQTINKRGNN